MFNATHCICIIVFFVLSSFLILSSPCINVVVFDWALSPELEKNEKKGFVMLQYEVDLPDLGATPGTLELSDMKQNAHSNWITWVGFSPHDKTVVVTSADRTLKVWAAGARFFCPPFILG
jgi:WD40 repeat protein